MQNCLSHQVTLPLFTLISLIVFHRSVLTESVTEKKCKEYAELVFYAEESPVLRIDTGPDKIVSKCGIIETPLIVGGVKAKPMEFPHMAIIGYGKESISWQCGGSVISENYILTAAHCISSTDKGPAMKVRVGLIKINDMASTMQERHIVERIKHPEYKMPSRYHDIALLKLNKPLIFDPNVRPACLETDDLHVQTQKWNLTATGFGKTAYEAETGSDDLMKVNLDYVKPDICQKNYESEVGSKQMSDGLISNMLCAGVLEGGKDTCQGDSGGPLQRALHQPYCMYSIVGITSFGKFCAFKNSPAIYTKVSAYLNWIESIVWSK